MGCATDPIADFLTIIRNGVRSNKERVTTRVSKITLRISEILKKEGYIENYKVFEEGGKKFIRVHIRYLKNKKPAIRSLQRISKPGIRYYVGSEKIPYVMGGLGLSILSTNRGLMTDREARTANVGGELICKVW